MNSVTNCNSFEHNPDSYRDASLKLALSTVCKFTNLDEKGVNNTKYVKSLLVQLEFCLSII